jgi:hypothetical protein
VSEERKPAKHDPRAEKPAGDGEEQDLDQPTLDERKVKDVKQREG